MKKIGIIPALKTPYDIKMVSDFAKALNATGVEAHYFRRPIEDDNLNKIVSESKLDVVLRVNKFPPQLKNRANSFRHISWFQDVFPSNTNHHVDYLDGDLFFTLGDKKALGLKLPEEVYAGSLNLAVNPDDFKYLIPVDKLTPQIDISLVAFIPYLPNHHLLMVSDELNKLFSNLPPLCTWQRRLMNVAHWALIFSRAREFRRFSYKNFSKAISYILRNSPLIPKVADDSEAAPIQDVLTAFIWATYRPLEGSLDISKLEQAIFDRFDSLDDTVSNYMDFACRELPRFIDRYVMIYRSKNVTENLAIYGQNWDLYPEFQPYHKGLISQNKANLVFQNSKINLHNNNHGIGLHSRSLNCMAAGGFLLTHTSDRDFLDGGMKSVFEPGIHYGTFSLESYEDDIHYWLENGEKRQQIIKNVQKYVMNELTWLKLAKYFISKMKE